jgi:hypothetical protein
MRAILPHNSLVLHGITRALILAPLAILTASVCGAQLVPSRAPAASALPAPLPMTQGPITIKDPAEFRDHQMAEAQFDPKAKAAALESFLTAYPQSVAKSEVLDVLIDTYQGLQDTDKALNAASRLLIADPSNLKAIFISVLIKKGQCAKTVDQKTGLSNDLQICDDAATLAQKGLTAPKPAAVSDQDWKKLTEGTYPVFHSAIALDDVVSKKDVKAGISEYRTELMLYGPERTKSGPGLLDTMQLAEDYTKPDGLDLAQAVWFYARTWNFAPAPMKTPIAAKLEYSYKKHHGDLDGLDAIKTQAKASLFPPEKFFISPELAPVETVREPIRRQKHSAPIPAPAQSPAHQEAVMPAKPPEPEAPLWPANEKPAQAAITWDSQGLRIEAANSSLQQIMKDVATLTGAKVEGLDSDERIFGGFGPGPARDVLSQLLQGSGYNVLMIGDQGEGTPREILLSARNAAAATQAANPNPSSDEETEPEEQPQPQPLPRPPMRPGFGPGGQRGPQQFSPEMRQPRPQPGQPGENPQPQ